MAIGSRPDSRLTPVARGNAALGLGAVAVMAALTALGPPLIELLRYDRGAILHGQLWRLFTGHFVHGSWPHLWLDAAPMVIVWLLCLNLLRPVQWLITIAVGVLVVGLGLLALSPGITLYLGFSGVLYSVYVVGAVGVKQQYPLTGALLLALIVAKVLYEAFRGPLPGTEAQVGGKVAIDPHLYGALGGLLAAWLGRRLYPKGPAARPVP
jgi:rhomboid family GlyGly-CTERM serine protease